MEILDIAGKSTTTLYWQPENELEEIIQNVRTILTTLKGTVPLDRGFGMDTSLIDTPTSNIEGRLTVEIMEAVERYEPRVQVQAVSFEGDAMDGSVYPRVKVVIL